MLKISGKIIYSAIGVVAGCALTVGLVTTNAARGSYSSESSEPSSSSAAATSTILSTAPSSESVSSLTEPSAPSSTVPTSSKTEIEKQTDSGVSRIQKATDSGVSKIEEAASQAVQEVKQAVGETSSETGLVVTCATNKITKDTGRTREDGSKVVWDLGCESYLARVDETGKCVIISYGGHFGIEWDNVSGLKDAGFEIKNAEGVSIDFEQGKPSEIKVPYQNLSEVSEVYLAYGDQSIKITVS